MTATHPLPVGLRVRNYGQQYPEARKGTATIVEIARGPFVVQGDTLYEYVVRVDARHSHTGVVRLMEWSSEGIVPGALDDEPHEITHDSDRATCSCGFTGDEALTAQHFRAYGMCGECYGSGTDAYPCLGRCGMCGGSGTSADEAVGIEAAERIAFEEQEHEIEQERQQALGDEAAEAQERFEMDGGAAFYAPEEEPA